MDIKDINEELEDLFNLKTLPIHVEGHDHFHVEDGEIIYKAYKFTSKERKKLVFIIRNDRVMLIDAKIKKYKTFG